MRKQYLQLPLFQFMIWGRKDDSRPVVIIEAEKTKTTGDGIEKGNFKKADYIEFTKKTNNSIEFEVKPGVAGIYLMRFRFMNRNETPLKVKFKMEDAYGILMRNDTIEFFHRLKNGKF